ncbi:beta strand repeat-containing protein [Bradyrhizobium aeschynomenes]|uniref:beta strand repeat-containing protein n=1 Tax=Bradyrhizobium aeschynomenes TaxID=2734909 RepID=UPI001552E190|nr:VCBS domain-containing protein [Bradyrhizobium aeschynomenes]NPV19541.1 tandem-95 repeat protein [Bradyrhizobium aeschynomenes]
MNAPVLLAQLTGTSSQPTSASAKHIKIGKPQGSQSVTVQLNGQNQIDLSEIASERLTFVKIGSRLIILFDNQSTVAIEPVFDNNGAPLKDVSFEVGPDRIINGDQFAELFPITTDQSVLPAAGTAGAPGVPAGANFGAFTIDQLTGGTPLALLAGESTGTNFGDTPTTPNPTPIPGGVQSALLNEDGLSEGQPGGNGDVGGVATSFTGSLNVDFGTDVIGRAFAFAASQPGLAGLTSGGEEVHFAITTVNGQPELIGYIGSDPSIAANQVFTITLDAQTTIAGTYTVTLLRPLDHPVFGTEDTLNLTVNVIAIDGSGDTAPVTIVIGVNDDSPVASTVETTALAEQTNGEGGFVQTTETVDLGISWGADSGNSKVDGGSTGTVVDGDRSLVFASSEIATLQALGLTSNGETISYSLSADGTEIIATAGSGEGERTIFTVTLSDTGSGSYTFTLSDNIDHNGANGASQPLTFNVVATDADGDPVDSAFTVNIGDDGPSFGERPSYSVVDEDGLGNPGDSYHSGGEEGGEGGSFKLAVIKSGDADGEDLTVTETLGIRWGSDDANINVDGGINGAPVNGDRAVTFSADVVSTLEAQNLTSDGFALRYELSSNGTVLTAYRYDSEHETYVGADGKPLNVEGSEGLSGAVVFTVSLSDVDRGSYTFTLAGNLDHPEHGAEDDITLDLGFVATDSDGDQITDTFTVKVNDDAPVFGEKPSYSVVDEDGLGNSGDSYKGGTDAYGEDLTVTDTLGIRWGADSANSHVDGGITGASVNGDRAVTFAPDVVATLEAQNLTSDGFALRYELSADGTTLTAYRADALSEGSEGGSGTLVFTVSLSDQGYGSYTFTLSANLDHPQHGSEDDLTLHLGFVATDSDGDAITDTFTVKINDDAPVIGAEQSSGQVDEDGIGNVGDSYVEGNDAAGADLTVTKSLGILWGADGANSHVDGGIDGSPVNGDRAVTFDSMAIPSLAELGLTSNGVALTYAVTENGTLLTAYRFDGEHYIDANGQPTEDLAGAAVFTVSLSDQNAGSYTFTLTGNLDHPVHGSEDNQALFFSYTATDSDGDAINGSFVVEVNDDAPVLDGKPSHTVVDEDGLGNDGNSYEDGGDAAGAELTATGTLGIVWGADSANGNVDGGINGSPVNGDRAVTFAANVVASLEAQNLTSDGFVLHYEVSSNGTVLTAYRYDAANETYIGADGKPTEQAGAAVFTVSLSDKEAGSYTFELTGNLDHPVHGTEDDITLNLGFVATDSDGDAITGSFTVDVNDDAPTFGERVSYSVVDEDGLGNPGNSYADGKDAAGVNLTVTDFLGIQWGADSANSQVDGGISGSPVNGDRAVTFAADVIATLDAKNLTSNGFGLTYAVSENGTLLSAYRYDAAHETYVDANGKPTDDPASAAVFTVSLSDQGQGAYTFTLIDNIDHPARNTEDDVTLTLGFVATDSDGDAVTNTFTVKVNDDAPVLNREIATGVVDEDGLATGIAGGPNDVPGQNTVATGNLGISWGADSANNLGNVGITGASPVAGDRAVTFASDATTTLAGQHLTSNGIALTYAVSEGGTLITAYRFDGQHYIDGNGNWTNSKANAAVFTVKLSDVDSGSYTFTLLDNVDHPVPNTEDNIALTLKYVVTDSDGDQVSGTFKVNVNDDSPVAQTGTAKSIGEADLNAGGDCDFGGHDDDGHHGDGHGGGSDPQVTGALNINWGADNNDRGAADRSVSFANTSNAAADVHVTNGSDVALSGLTSDGQTVKYAFDHGVLVGYTGSNLAFGQRVFEVSLDDDGTGTYTFKLLGNLDHPAGQGSNVVKLTFDYTATDSDGDSSSSTFTVTIVDDVPTIGHADNETVSESNLPTDLYDVAFPDSPYSTVQTGGLAISWGADDNDSGATNNRSVAFFNTTAPDGLTSNGYAVSYVISADGTTLTAVTTDHRTVFTVTLSDDGDGSYKFTLLDNIDHSGAGSDSRALNFGFKATDSDGDSATSSFTVQVTDDVPTIGCADDETVSEASLPTTSYDTSHPDASNSTVQTGDLDISWGADDNNSGVGHNRSVVFTTAAGATGLTSDGSAISYTVSSDGTLLTAVSADNRTIFTIQLSDSGDGSYKFTLYDNLDHPSSGANKDSLPLTFGFKASDSDGDSVTSTFKVNVIDTAPVAAAGDSRTVDEDDLSNGTDSSKESTTVNGDLNISWGSDDNNKTAGGGLGDRSVSFRYSSASANVDAEDSSGRNLTLTSDGQTVKYAFENGVLVGYTGTDLAHGTRVFEVSLSDQNDGSYSFKLLGNIDHPAGSGENLVNLTFSFTATDGDGDTSSNSFTVSVKDDVPVVGTPSGATLTENTTGAAGAETFETQTASTIALNINWGADDGNAGTANRAIAFDPTIDSGDIVRTTGSGSPALTSNGVTVQFIRVSDTEIWGVANDNGGSLSLSDRKVFHVTLSDNGSGNYTFELLDNVDHIGSGQTNALALKLGFTATDADGDSATGNFTVTINDDNGRPAIGTPVAGTVDEDGLSGGNTAAATGDVAGANVAATGSLAISWGADDNNSGSANRAVAFSGFTNGANASSDAGLLKVNGEQVKYWVVGNTLYGYTGSNPVNANTAPAAANQVFKVSLDDSGSGSYSFTLLKHVDHPAGQNENDIKLTFGFTATDADGDSTSSSFAVTINDDSPVATATVQSVAVYESELPNGTVTVANGGLHGGDLNGDANGNDSYYTGNLTSLVSFGADKPGTYTVEKTNLAPELLSLTSGGVALTYSIDTANNMLVAKAGSVTIFEFQVDATTGQYSFRLKGALDHVGTGHDNALTLDMSTAVTAVDSDGDSLALHGQIIITVNDDSAQSQDVDTVAISEAAGSVSTGAVDLQIIYGADGDSSGPSVTFPGASPVRVYDAAHHQMSGLTSLGFGLSYVLSADHTTLTAYRMSGSDYVGQNGQVTGNAADAAVFTVTLSETGSGSYNFTLLQPLDHPAPIGTASAADQYLDLNFAFEVEDRDHDVFANNFTVRVDAAGTVTTTRYDAANSPVFINLGDSSATILGETVGAHSVTDRASVTDKVVGIDKLGGVTEAHGSGGDDILVGGSGIDKLFGGAGNDVIKGGAAADQLFGGSGNDTFLHTVGDGDDVVDGGSESGSAFPDYDVLAISGDANARNFTIGKTSSGTAIDPTLNDAAASNATDILVRYDGPNGATIRADEIERVTITGGGASDTVTITDISGTAIAPSTIVFNGGSGNDTLDLTRFAGNTSVVSDGGSDSDTVKFGFKLADATYTKVFGSDGVTLIGVQVTHGGLTDTFTNYESFTFTDGTRTLTGIFNTPPVAHDDKVDASEDSPLTINALLNLLNNDTDVDNDTLTVTGVGNATHGTVSLNNGNPLFTPDRNFSGVAGFDYTISDGDGGTATAHVTVDVAPKADSPTIGFFEVGPATGAEDSAVALKVMTAGVSDHDGSENLRMLITGYPDGATFSVGHAGTGADAGKWVIDDQTAIVNFNSQPLKVTPPANYNGTFTLSVSVEVTDQATLSDGQVHRDVAITDLQTIDVTVTPVNDAPEIHAPTQVTTNEDTSFQFTGANAFNFSDADGDVVAFVRLDIVGGTLSIPSLGVFDASQTLTMSGFKISDLNNYLASAVFTPAANNDVAGSVTITINDNGNVGSGGSLSATQTITININPIEDAPVAADDTATATEDTTLTVSSPVQGVLHNDRDPDTGDTLSVVAGDFTTAKGGTIHFNADGTYVYKPKADFYGADTIDYTVRDAAGQTDTGTLTINVTPVNDAPEVHAPTQVTANQGVAFAFSGTNAITFSDADGDVVAFVRLDIVGGTISIPSLGVFDASQTLTMSGFKISDLNHYLESAVFTPNSDQPGSVTITINDNGNVGGGSLSDSQTVNIAVIPANDPPVANSDTNAVLEDGTINIAAANGVVRGSTGGSVADTDADTGVSSLVVSGVVAGTGSVTQGAGVGTSIEGAYGHLTLNADGSYTYVADKAAALAAGVNAIDTFTYTDKDPSGAVSNTATLKITVTGVNDAAVITGDTTGTIAEEGGVGNSQSSPLYAIARGDLNSTDVDGHNDVWQAAASNTANGYGWFDIGSDGKWTYGLYNNNPTIQALKENQTTLTDSFTVYTEDGTPKTVTIQIIGNNDAPTLQNAIVDHNSAEDQPFSFTIPANTFADIDGRFDGTNGPLTLEAVQQDGSALPAWLHFDAATGTFSGTPPVNFAGAVNVTVYAGDGEYAASDTFTLTITPVNDGAATVTVTGTANQGQTLTANLGSDPDGAASNVVYHWLRDGAVINGASGTTYTLGANDVGHKISANVTYIDGQGFSENVTSSQTGTVTVPNHAPTFGSGTTAGSVTEDASYAAPTGNLVQNGTFSFYNNDWYTLDAWTVGGAHAVTVVGGRTDGGSADFYGASSSISQTISTVVGVTYTVDFYVMTYGTALTSAVDGTTVLTTSNWNLGWTEQSYQFTATSTSTTIKFASAGGAAIDDISVQASTVVTPGVEKASGAIAFTDVEGDVQTVTYSTPNGSNYYGSFNATVDNTNHKVNWTFSVNDADIQSLRASDHIDQTYTVKIDDGHGGTTTQTVTITVNGVNDAASISGTAAGTVKEDGTLTAGGTLTVSDVDSGENQFQTPASLAGTYGTFTFNAVTGAWGYTLNNSAANVQALNDGDVKHDTLTVKSVDGTASQVIDVTINGTNEPAPLAVVDTTSVDGRYALSKNTDSPNTISLNAASLFSGGYGTVTYTYALVYSSTGDDGWIQRSGNQFSGNPDNNDAGLYVYKVTATDSVSSVSTYLAFNALDNGALNLTINSLSSNSNVVGSAPWLSGYSANDGDAITATVDNILEANANNGYDVMIGSSGGNNFNGGADDDGIYGLGGNDTLLGGANTDYINGGAGNDSIRGGSGNDFTIGGSGNDTFYWGVNDGVDIVDGGIGTDTFTIEGTSSQDLVWVTLAGGVITDVNGTKLSNIEAVTADLGSSSSDTLTYVTSEDVTVNLGAGTATGFSSIASIERVTGGSGDDTLIGSGANNTINGGDGDDIIRGGGGSDTIDGGVGIDLLDFSDATAGITFTLAQSSSNTTGPTLAGIGQDTYKNMEGVIGSNFNDTIIGSSSADVLIGGRGSDQLTGNGGSDTFKWQAGDLTGGGLDSILDFQSGSGGDVIDLSGLLSGVSGNHADAVRFVDGGGHSSLASANGSGVLNNGDLTLQVNLGSGWTNVATIKDTGTNFTGGDDVIKMILDNSHAQTQVHV